MATLELIITPEQIAHRLAQIAETLESEYPRDELVLVMVMKGAICLVADLMRQLQLPTTLEFIHASSYGTRGRERGPLHLEGLDQIEATGKNILIIDDIFDSGVTLSSAVDQFRQKSPKTLRSLVLLEKQVARESSYLPDYVLFTIENHFVVGYGLDFKEHYRGLPGVYILNPEEKK